MASFDLAVVPWGIWANELMADAQLSCGSFKQGSQVSLGVGEAVGELKAIVGLDTLHGDASSLEPLDSSFEEVSGGVSGLLLVSPEETQTRELVDGGILEQV